MLKKISLSHKILITFVILGLVGIFSTLGVAYTFDEPLPFGHSSEEVIVFTNDTEMSLQEAIDKKLLGSSESITQFGEIFAYKRGDAYSHDQIIWCPDDYPKIVSCSYSDDEAPNSINTVDSDWSSCTTDGLCDQSGARGNLGGDGIYLEYVRTEQGKNGCLAYDSGHSHASYKLDVVCAKSNFSTISTGVTETVTETDTGGSSEGKSYQTATLTASGSTGNTDGGDTTYIQNYDLEDPHNLIDRNNIQVTRDGFSEWETIEDTVNTIQFEQEGTYLLTVDGRFTDTDNAGDDVYNIEYILQQGQSSVALATSVADTFEIPTIVPLTTTIVESASRKDNSFYIRMIDVGNSRADYDVVITVVKLK